MVRVFFTRTWCPFLRELNAHLRPQRESPEREVQQDLAPATLQPDARGQHQQAGASARPGPEPPSSAWGGRGAGAERGREDLQCFQRGRAVKLDWTGELHCVKRAERKKAGDVVTVIISKVCYLLVSLPALQIIACDGQWMSTQSRVVLE